VRSVSIIAATACCALSAMTAGGVVTTRALLGLVLPSVILVVLAGLASRRRPWVGAITVGVVALGLAELANVMSGDYQGPVARATLGSALLAGAAGLLAGSRWPALFLLPVASITVWDVSLGGAGKSRLVVVLLVIAASLTLLSSEQDHRRWSGPPPLTAAMGVLILAVTVTCSVAVLQAARDNRPAAHPFAVTSLRQGSVLPDPFPSQRGAPVPVSRPAHPRASARQVPLTERSVSLSRPFLLADLAFLLALFALAALRLVWVRISWRRYRRSLLALGSADGAWLWVRAQLWALRRPLPAAASPDVVAVSTTWPELRELAKSITPHIFGQAPGDNLGLWAAADRASRTARDRSTRLTRVLVNWRGVPGGAV
jgi:uncharacterized membrane protein YqjE